MSIKIYYDEIRLRYRGWLKLRSILAEIIGREKSKPGEISVILTTDENLRRINVEFLEHDYYTDVITFNYNSENLVQGEIYISIDTVRENSYNYNVSLHNELSRVIIHGVLHLAGHDDKTEEQRMLMRREEDYWLTRLMG